jgi:twitching motility protein PilT
MAAVDIDRLLEACIKMGGSDLRLTVGRPPELMLHGCLRALDTKVLEPEDTTALMKSITPDKNQQEFQETGSTDYGFAFGDKACFRTSVSHQKGNIAMVFRLVLD